MCAGTGIEFVWDLFFEQFLMKVAVHLEEEVLGAAVDDDVHRAWLEKVCHIDDSIVFPILRILVFCSDSFCNAPFFRERTEIYATGCGSHRSEDILMPDSEEKSAVSSHGKTGDGPSASVPDSLVVPVNEFHQF